MYSLIPNTKLHEKFDRVDTRGQTDMTKLTGAFRD